MCIKVSITAISQCFGSQAGTEKATGRQGLLRVRFISETD